MFGNPLSPLADCSLLRLLGLRHLLFELGARLKQLTDALFKRICFLPGTAQFLGHRIQLRLPRDDPRRCIRRRATPVPTLPDPVAIWRHH